MSYIYNLFASKNKIIIDNNEDQENIDQDENDKIKDNSNELEVISDEKLESESDSDLETVINSDVESEEDEDSDVDTDEDDEFEVSSTTTRGLVSAFSKYTSNRVSNRIVLNRFINLIA